MSKKIELSPWHDGSVKPVHVGVYEVRGEDGTPFVAPYYPSYAHYSKKSGWTTATDLEYAAKKYIGWGDPCQKKQWRGVLK